MTDTPNDPIIEVMDLRENDVAALIVVTDETDGTEECWGASMSHVSIAPRDLVGVLRALADRIEAEEVIGR